MAKLHFEGMAEYELKLSKLKNGSKEIAAKAIYAGAAIMADEIKANIKELPVQMGARGDSKNKINSITPVQKEGLMESFGISSLQEDHGFWNVKLGFDGYNRTRTKKYPKGQPNAMIARSVESGTSFRKKNPFIKRAIKAKETAVVAEMGRIVDEEIKKMMS